MKGKVDAVYCEFKYSGVGAGLLSLAVTATLAIVAVTPLSLPLQTALAFWVIAAALRALRISREVRALRLDLDGEIRLELRGGATAGGVVRPGSFVAPWLTILRWRPVGAWFDRTLLVLPDMLPADDSRRLRVLLRMA